MEIEIEFDIEKYTLMIMIKKERETVKGMEVST